MYSPERLWPWLRYVALALLSALAGAYWLTVEPAPRIRVLWAEGVTPQQQRTLEYQYSLFNGRDRMPEGSIAYDLLDTSRSNIRSLVGDPAVTDTNDIDRDAYVVSAGVDRGGERMWAANRVPGLRRATVRSTLIAILAMVVIATFRREGVAAARRGAAAWSRMTAVWHAHLRAPLESRDVFDEWSSRFQRVEDANPSALRYSVLAKLAVAILLVTVTGVPILETWEALGLAAVLLALVFGACRPGSWRILASTALVVGILGVKAALPRADIAEAHNAFMVLEEGEPLQRGLPPAVFDTWRQQFTSRYLQPAEPVPENSWRAARSIPTAVYTRSSDAIWRDPRYTRQVDAIAFRSLAEFRGGFANEGAYNFWTGDLDRHSMPFYVMYELSAGSVGSQLVWTGQAFWERQDGRFQAIVHDRPLARTIQPGDIGKKVYALFFADTPLYFEMIPSWTLRLSGWADVLLTLAGCVSILALTIRLRWGGLLRAASMFAIGYWLAILSYTTPGSDALGRGYLPHGGGSDGLMHEDSGRTMAMLLGDGRIVEAFEGREPVYWFTPGTRYVRMVEKLVFGDTNHLFALLLAAIPIVVFCLLRRLTGTLPAWVVTGVFCVLPVGSLSFPQYVLWARAGYGEGIACGLFLLGVVLMLRTQPAWGGSHRRLAEMWVAGAALAGSMFIRPNFALAVAGLGAAYVFVTLKRKDIGAAAALAAGLALALWMPFHNWYYGGAFYLISRGGEGALPIGASDYLLALKDVTAGRLDTDGVSLVSSQLSQWLLDPGFVLRPSLLPLAWAVHAFKLAGLLATCWLAVRWIGGRSRAQPAVGLLAMTALLAHAPMLFVFNPSPRYAMLGWDLTLIVLIAWAAGRSLNSGGTAGAKP